ncbi:MAG: hypothetical protein AAF296_10260 [Pseudomonadota bacterium]
MVQKRTLAAIAGLMLLGACVTATPYQAASDGQKGYANQQIESNRWQVSFSGNSLTERKTVETYLLYRAAELTSQQGFDHFRVVTRETDAERSLIATGFSYDPFYSGFACNYRFYGRRGRLSSFHRRASFGYRSRFGYNDPFWGGYDVREIIRYEASAEIKMGRGPKPDDVAFFSASEVLQNLSPTIVRPEVS